MRAYERFLKYVKVHTTSDENTGTLPSTGRQFVLADSLASEMQEIGFSDVRVDEKCYVYGSIPAAAGYENSPCIGFLSHMDTSPEASGENVSPVLWRDYDGTDIVLGNGRVLSADLFPHLPSLQGRTLITADGTTLLGADDKAGIAEIMTMAETIISRNIPHGRIAVAFTPDEEIGHGAEELDLEAFGAEFAYTVDGGPENELEYENFNAAKATFRIRGRSVHPGDAKGIMINAGLVACEIVSMLPPAETPANTEGREGFYHVTGISGSVEQAVVSLIIRDHSAAFYDARINTVEMISKVLNEKYGDGTVRLEVKEQYRNMLEKIQPFMHIVENARAAMKDTGMTPSEIPVRGGTDGARLSFRGLPCPNLGTGGYAFHGPYEHITVEGMDRVVDVLLGIVKRYARKEIKVVAGIIRKENLVFATQRGYGDYKDWWEFPGGKIEEGETPEEALIREIREELDTEIEVDSFLTTVEYDYPEFHLSMDCFLCHIKKGELTLLEHEAARWLPADDLKQVDWLPADVLVTEAIERGSFGGRPK